MRARIGGFFRNLAFAFCAAFVFAAQGYAQAPPSAPTLPTAKDKCVLIKGAINEETYAKVQDQLAKLEEAGSPDIEVRIMSPGGGVEASLGIYDLLRCYAGLKTGFAVKGAHSGASIILQACEKRKMTRNAMMLVHNARMFALFFTFQAEDPVSDDDPGSVGRLKADLAKMDRLILGVYMRNAKVPEAEMKRFMKRETLLTAEEALKLGLITEIVDGPPDGAQKDKKQ